MLPSARLYFPILIATGLIVVGGLLFYQAFFGHIAHEGGFELDWRAVALVSAGLIVQMLLLESLGWIVATTLLFVAATLAFREPAAADQRRHRRRR